MKTCAYFLVARRQDLGWARDISQTFNLTRLLGKLEACSILDKGKHRKVFKIKHAFAITQFSGEGMECKFCRQLSVSRFDVKELSAYQAVFDMGRVYRKDRCVFRGL